MTVVRRCLVVLAMLAVPVAVCAQEAVLNGTVTDATGGVLPGVTVTATNEATGNTFMAVTDEGGRYRIPVRTGAFRLVCELAGFATVSRTGVRVLVGQTVTINLQMTVSGVAETVTVTGETPLVDTTTSALGGNVDPTQVAELPVSGRNFMALAMMAPGARTTDMNATQPLPDRGRADDVREFQINLDGQQVTRDIGTGTQPKYSQDMIAEFQYIANRFDATMGRSSGVQLNIITKSGTNTFSGVGRLNYRSDRFNAEEPVLKRKLTINNLQMSTAAGGPIIENRLHYFGNFEYERQPTESVWNTPYPSFNITLNGTSNQKKGGLRGDWQLSPNARLMVKGSNTRTFRPFGAGSTSVHPASTSRYQDFNNEFYTKYTHVLSNRAVNELEGGRAVYGLDEGALTSWSNHWLRDIDGTNTGSPRIRFRTFQIAPNRNLPRYQTQWYWSIKDNFTFSYEAKGRHDLRLGGEYLYRHQIQYNRLNAMGEIDARGGPTPANLEALFPVWNNVDTWNLAALSPITRSYLIGVGNFANHVYSGKVAAWAQDDWRITDRLTLNLGVRWDAELDAIGDGEFLPWAPYVPGQYDDWNNFQPRLGFAYSVNDRTVIRGGVGLYIAGATSGDETRAHSNTIQNIIRFTNDGRADFAVNPANGPLPTYEQSKAFFCHNNNNAPGCLLLDAIEVVVAPKYEQLGHNWQTSIGFQRQVAADFGFEVDYIYAHSNNEKGIVDNANLTFDPATGANYPFSNRATRFLPNWGAVSLSVHTGASRTHELRSSFTKRFSHHWQATGTYSMRWFKDMEPRPFSGFDEVSFPTVPDLGGEWAYGEGDQRHRAVFTGIWEVGKGFQVSGLMYVGSGIRLDTRYGDDLRDVQGEGGTERLRPDGTIVPRNSVVSPAQNRTDLRLQQKLPLGGRLSVDLIAEVFNLFNQPNWSIGSTENRADYLEHTSGQYRTAQMGFRVRW
ncbi:MAG: TonB-dependent receptor [Acidobacteriota bacterium]